MPTTDLSPCSTAVELKRILVLSDDPRFAHVLDINLRDTAAITVQIMGQAESLANLASERWHLIIIALSRNDSEPILALSQAALLRQTWQAPLLIISDRPFPSEPRRRIYHHLFPVYTEALRRHVQELLG